jgi:hypothetical protein
MLYLFIVPPMAFIGARHLSSAFIDPTGAVFWVGARYTFLTTFLVIIGVAVLLARITERMRRTAATPALLLILFSAGIWSNFSNGDWPDLNWALGAQHVAQWERSSDADAVSWPINPTPWMLTLPKK